MKYRWTALLIALTLIAAASSPAPIDRNTLRWMRDKPPIQEIVINGNSYFSDGRVRDQMYSKVRTFWAALKGDRRSRLQRETYARDTVEIKSLYLRHGFLGIRVDESFEVILPDSTARVVVDLDEGRQFIYGDATIEGDFNPASREDLYKTLSDLEPREPVNYYDVHQAGFDMKTVMANNGYPYASVTPYIDTFTVNQVADIKYTIRSDSLVHFGDVAISGTGYYPEYAARRELKVKPGDVYRRSDIVESQRRLFESGYFSTLQLQRAPTQDNRYRPDFVLHVKERKPRYVTFSTGAGQSKAADLTWSFTGAVGKRNIFGSRRLDLSSRLEFSLGSESRITDHLYRLRYTEPWFIGLRWPVSLSLEYQPRRRHEAQDFDVEQWSISLSTSKRFGRNTELTGGLEYQQVDIGGVPDEVEEDVRNRVEGLSIRRRLYLTLIRDSRDFVFVPSRGSVRELSAEYYGGFLGGDENFYKFEAAWSIYRRVWPGWVFATRVRSGIARAFGESSLVPSQDRLFLGGANTIRGFNENSLAPVRLDDLPGADFTVVYNLEFRWKTHQIFQPIPLLNKIFANLPLWQSVFFDMGNGFIEHEDFKFELLAYTYGTGIQIISPAGPIRLDYARRIKTRDIGFDERWHFTILYAF